MSIVALKKISLCGLLREKQTILTELQRLGCLHLLPLRPPPAEVEKLAAPRAEAAYKALRFLNGVAQKRRQVMRDPDFDVDRRVAEVLEVQQQLRDSSDRRDFLKQRIAAIEPWGDIDFPPGEALAGYRLWFYVLPLGRLRALQRVQLPWQIVRRDHRVAYVVVIARQEPRGDLLPVPRTHVGALPLGELQAQLDEVEVELEELVARRQALTRYIYLLSLNLARADNRASLNYAAQQTRDGDSIVAVQGWVPVPALPAVRAYAEQAQLACLVEEPGPEDTPPTLIEQPEPMNAGVDLTLFYQVPNYRSWDPTRLLFASFSVFFAMILADAGYGALLLLGLLAYWRRLGRSRRGRAYRLLAASMFGCTLAYGAMVGSYFGLSPPPGSLLAGLHVLNVDDFDTMMKLSIIVGVLHIGFANIMMAYIHRRRLLALSKLGWIGVIGGALLLWLSGAAVPGAAPAAAPAGSLGSAAMALMAGGLLAIVLFSSERPLQRRSDYLWRLAEGVFNLRSLLNAFGDVLSYMRLFALGLASASLAMTFNDLARDAAAALPGVGLLAALLILGIGHLLNLALALISGVVHGLRLNFIEFYNWGLPEEGKPFQKFARKEVKP